MRQNWLCFAENMNKWSFSHTFFKCRVTDKHCVAPNLLLLHSGTRRVSYAHSHMGRPHSSASRRNWGQFSREVLGDQLGLSQNFPPRSRSCPLLMNIHAEHPGRPWYEGAQMENQQTLFVHLQETCLFLITCSWLCGGISEGSTACKGGDKCQTLINTTSDFICYLLRSVPESDRKKRYLLNVHGI